MKTAQTTARTAREMFKQLNDELEAQGKMAFEGRVNKKYFDARVGIES